MLFGLLFCFGVSVWQLQTVDTPLQHAEPFFNSNPSSVALNKQDSPVESPPLASLTTSSEVIDVYSFASLKPTFSGGNGILTHIGSVVSGLEYFVVPDITTTYELIVTSPDGRETNASVAVQVSDVESTLVDQAIADNVTPWYHGINRTFNHPIWKIYFPPKLVNFPNQGIFLQQGMQKPELKEQVYYLRASEYDLGASGTTDECPFQCLFNTNNTPQGYIHSSPSCRDAPLNFVFGLESTRNSWWSSSETFRSCSFTMRSDMDSTVPMLGQFKSFFPINWKTGLFEAARLPFIPYSIKRKRPLMSVVISNCGAGSRRDEVLGKLRELNISIANYGDCNNLNADWNDLPLNDISPRQKSLLEQLSRSGKFGQKDAAIAGHLFHFAAENSICDWYHTEKPFQALKVGTLGIYIGARTIYPYLPEKSMLVIWDYKNVYELVKHLHELANDEAKYREYMMWRRKPIAEPVMDILSVAYAERSPQWLCELCKLVATTPPGQYESENAGNECEDFPLEEFLKPDGDLPAYVERHMRKDKVGGRRW